MAIPNPDKDREFARIPVRIPFRFRLLDEEEARDLESKILDKATVWAPQGESALKDLASSSQSGSEGILAQAILDISAQIARIFHRVFQPEGPMEPGTVTDLSGGGCQIATSRLLQVGAVLQFRFEDDGSGVPPIQTVAEVVHDRGTPPGRYGVRFSTIHPADQQRLIELMFLLQRRSLRKQHEKED